MLKFDWHAEKAYQNKLKHGVSFELASRVWDDPHHKILPENTYAGEERWLAVGRIGLIAIVVVVHTYRTQKGEDVVRIISARKATPHERKSYEQPTVF